MIATPVSIVVPTFNEAGNIQELVRRIDDATAGMTAEVIFVDDSSDDTPDFILAASETSRTPVRLIHRDTPTGGLSGAVVEGLRAARHDWVLVMDGDLQHPPEMIPVLLGTASLGEAELVVASRYCGSGDAAGLANSARRAVSSLSTVLTRSMFPSRLRDCTDPMTGFFLVRSTAIDLDGLEPRGFKILLEIIARQPRRLAVMEEPFVFGQRFAGESKASLSQGLKFLRQLLHLRFGRMSRFALVGALGAVVNIALVALLTTVGLGYLVAATIAAEVTILGNFLLLERFVFRGLTGGSRWWHRLWKSLAFNNAETMIRLPLLYVLVDLWTIASVPATALTLLAAFLARFVFHSRMVYAAPATHVGTASVERATAGPDVRERDSGLTGRDGLASVDPRTVRLQG